MFNSTRINELEKRITTLEGALVTLLRAEVSRGGAKKLGRPVGSKTKKARKMHKKHMFTYECDVCGRECKGKMGLGVHKAMKHDVHTSKIETVGNVFTV